MHAEEIRFTSPIRCGHCGNLAPMKVVASYSSVTTQEGEYCGDPDYDAGDIYQVLLCPACNAIGLRSYFWHEGYMESEEDITFRQLYPSDIRVPSGLPTQIEKAFAAALKVKPIDSNAFGVLIGRVIELVCADRNASGRFLSNKLGDLSKRSEIPQKLVGVATGLSKLRNVGAHAELGELTAEEVPIMEDLCRALLDYVYSAPFLAQKAQDRIDHLILRRKASEKHN
jgi:hypothetical protein